MEKAAKMSSIPEEIYDEILLRLPVKSLLVCKSVCKKWYALITSSDFVKTHITIHKNYPNLMLKAYCYSTKRCLLYSIDYDSLASSSIVVEDDQIDAIERDYPFKSLGYNTFQLLGSSNGIICMRMVNLFNDDYLFCLWNPATREYKEIQFLDAIESYDRRFMFNAFGYDHKTDDYKLAIGVDVPDSNGRTIYVGYIYMLASDSWKQWETIPYWFLRNQRSGVIFNGDFHWLAIVQESYLLLSFDISDETFKEMQLPKELLKVVKNLQNLMEAFHMFLGVLEGCLCILFNSDANSQFEVWEMLDYSVQESWTKRYVIAHESIIRKQFYFRLVLSFKNGVILFLNSDGLVLYDLNNGSARELKINNNPDLDLYGSKNYFKSLISLKSST